MADATSLRIELLGERVGSYFTGEIWQTGISCVEGSAGGVFPGAIKQSLPSFSVRSVGDTSDDATWSIYWAWEGLDKVTKQNQVGLANAALSFFNGLKALVPAGSQMTGVRINAVQATGKVYNGANYFYLKTPVNGGSTASSQLPPQLAVVLSLRTGARGPGGRGRMYLPLTGGTLSNGRITSANQTTITATGKAFLEAIHAIGPLPSVVNQKKQTYSAIDRVEVGDLMDVQRRRRNNFVEDYVTAGLSYA